MASLHNSKPDTLRKKSGNEKIFYKCFYEKHFKFYTVKLNLCSTIRTEPRIPQSPLYQYPEQRIYKYLLSDSI